MADAGIDDILVGYPIVGERKLARLMDLTERASITVTLDSEEVALGVSRAARGRGLVIRALLELDTGMHRLGVEPGPAAVELAERVAALDGIELAGVFTHEGHVYTQARDDAERERLTLEACGAAVATAQEIRARGIAAPVVSVGSAGTFRFAIRCPGVTEVRPGTYVFNDRSQMAQGAAGPTDLAAFVITTVVGRPTPERIVVDAGSKVLTSDRMLVPEPPSSFGWVWGHDDWDVVRLSEEHGVVEVPADADVAVGDRLAIVPNHVCPTINLASFVTVVEGGRVAGRWPVAARGMVQ
jgi:D-serine deaminase-like pyridoxal phosphate-dependent protein